MRLLHPKSRVNTQENLTRIFARIQVAYYYLDALRNTDDGRPKGSSHMFAAENEIR